MCLNQDLDPPQLAASPAAQQIQATTVMTQADDNLPENQKPDKSQDAQADSAEFGYELDENEDSVTAWLHGLADGDSRAQQLVWDRYAESVMRLAKKLLGELKLRALDEEDIAVQVLANLFDRMQAGDMRQPLQNRKQLTAFLFGSVRNKTLEAKRNNRTQKRGEGKVRGESVFVHEDSAHHGIQFAAIDNNDPQKIFFAAEQLEEFFDFLDNDDLRLAAFLRMAGWKNQEIADQMEQDIRHVERLFHKIREKTSTHPDWV